MDAKTAFTSRPQHVVPCVSRSDSGFKRICRGLLAGLGAAVLLVCGPALAQDVGEAQSFAILGGSGVSFNGAISTIDGDVGIEPTAISGITGFPGSATITPPFSMYGPPDSDLARAATLALYNSAVMVPGGFQVGNDLSIDGPDPLSPGTYTPGTYSNSVAGGVAIMPTGITLDGPGIYIFTLANALTANGDVTYINGADPCSVYWRVPTLATLNAAMGGTIVAETGVHMGVGATLTGRALVAAAGDVTLAGDNTVGGCSAPAAEGGPGLAATSLSTEASASVAVGGMIFDTATLSDGGLGGAAPTGTITFNLYAPSDPTCAAAPAFTSTVPVTGNGIYTSASFVSAAIGTYHWIASYSGDANNDPFEGACGDDGESVIVTAAVPPSGVTSIPTLSEWAMILLAMLLAIVGFTAMRRRDA